MNKLISILLIIVSFFSSLFGFADTDKATNAIKQNFYRGMKDETLSVFEKLAQGTTEQALYGVLRQTDNGEAYFSDYTYETSFNAEIAHQKRLLFFALSYRNETDADKKEAYRKTAQDLLAYYVHHDYQSENWWYNEIFTPNCIGEAVLLLDGGMDDALKEDAIAIIKRGTFAYNDNAVGKTGANCLWFCESTLKYCALTGDEIGAKYAVYRLTEELSAGSDEGIQNDGSFFQHEKRLYTGGYGISFVESVSKLLYLLNGTRLAPSQNKLTAFALLITKGLAEITFGNTLDYMTVGRKLSRQDNLNAESLLPYLNILLKLDNMPQKDAVSAYIQSIQNNTSSDMGVTYFEDAAFTVIHNSDFYFSFQGGKKGLYYAEALNGENVLGYNLSYGTSTAIMHTGKEYDNIAPLWDYSLIPGTTAEYETDEELLKHTEFNKRQISGSFGGTQKGNTAVSFYAASHEGIYAKVVCFATEHSALLMGTDMKNSDNTPMITTLDQCYYTGTLLQSGNTVIHNGIKYTLLMGGELKAEHKTVSGAWSRNRLSSPNNPVSGELFTITMKNTGSYAYCVMSEQTNDAYEIIQNSDKLQAAKLPNGNLAAVFYEKTCFTYNGKTYQGKAGDILIAEVS